MAIPRPSGHGPGRRLPRWQIFMAAGVVVIALAFVIRPQLARHAQLNHALEADSLDAEHLDTLLVDVDDPAPLLRQLWDTGRIPHRRVVLQHLLQPQTRLLPLARELILEAATDPDVSLRELALGSLRPAQNTDVAPILLPQLADPDPDLRLQALQTLRRAGHAGWTPHVLPFLLDADATLAIAADSLLRRWSSIDSGLRFADLEADRALDSPSRLTETQRADLASAHKQRIRWWEQNRGSHSTPPPWEAERSSTRRRADSTGPWSLPDLDGRLRSLDEFRGRTVLLNFWATWCPPCLRELPTLTQLQSEVGTNRLVILGVCLDSLTPLSHDAAPPAGPPPSTEVHARNIRLIALRHRLNYPVLLDPEQRVGRSFDGQELPTQVLIDRQGRLVRRFLGPRSLEAWRALLANADQAGLQAASDLPIE